MCVECETAFIIQSDIYFNESLNWLVIYVDEINDDINYNEWDFVLNIKLVFHRNKMSVLKRKSQ